MSSKKSRKRKNIIYLLAIAAIIVLIVIVKYKTPTDKIAATVNGEQILKEDVLKEYLKVPLEYRKIITVDSILEGMIIEKLMLQEASKQGITVTDEEVEELIQGLLDAYGMTEENLTKSLEKEGTTLEELKSSFKKRLIITKLLNQTILSDISVSEKEMENYYVENTDQFTTPEKVRASHILVNSSKEAQSIRNKALEGVGFEELAEKHSLCPSSAQGGDLGWFERGQMVKEFEDAAFDLGIGDISSVVETQFGFHIIKLTDRSPESKQTYDEVKDQIEGALLTQKQNYAAEIFAQQLRASTDIQIFMKSKEEPQGTPISEIIKQQKEEKEKAEITGATTTEKEPEEETEQQLSLAECLASKGTKMYGSEKSSISLAQKELFGNDFSAIDYIDCGSEKEICKGAGIISYPTWVINGKKYPGKYSLERIAEMSGC